MDSVSASNVSTLVIKPATKGSALVSMAPDCTVQVNAPTFVLQNLEAPIAVDAKTLVGACKNREVQLAVNGTEISIKSGKSYNASVACSDEVPQIPDGLSKLEEATTQIVLTADNILALKAAVSSTRIEKTYTGIVDTLVAVRATAKAVTVMSYEPSQVSSTTVKNASGIPDCFFVLPSGIFAKALNLPGDVKIQINENTAVFSSKACLVRVNLPIDTVNAIDKDQVFTLVASVKSTDAEKPSLVTTKAALAGFLDNAESLIQVGGDVVIASSGSSITASVTTVKGTVKEKFSGSASKPFTLGYAFMRAIVSRAKEGSDIELKTTEAFAVVKSGTSTYIAALSES
jgi:hypothetical protein